MIKGVVAIVGRPNVGKSTIFNKITKSNQAIVDDMPGVTRDRIYGYGLDPYSDDKFIVVDTGGFETKDFYFQPFVKNIVWEQTEIAIEECDLILFVLDGKAGLHPHDRDILNFIKSKNKPIITVCNKIDGIEQESKTWEFFQLGIEIIEPLSAAHSRGIGELRENISDNLDQIKKQNKTRKEYDDAINVAIIGKPNAGKSSILNRILGEERSLVSEVAGTTRDSIDSFFIYNKQNYRIIDTAGIRRKTKISEKIESLSVIRSIKMIEEAQIVLMVITDEGLTDQDSRLLSLCASRYKPVILVINKWDLVADKNSNTMKNFKEDIKHDIRTMEYLPMVFTSCLTGQRVSNILPMIEKLYASFEKRVSTSVVNQVLEKAVARHTPQLIKNHSKRIKFYYGSQVAVKPPAFVIKCNISEEIKESYKRYLNRRFQSELGFDNLPIKIFYRGKGDKQEAPKENVETE